MYTILANRPINPVTRELLALVNAVARQGGRDYLLVGATARDILMNHVFGIASRRATRDVDFAVALEDWDSFDAFKADLVRTTHFATVEKKDHLLYYKPGEHGTAYPLDLIPFGGLERDHHHIAWPPDMNIVMNVTGYGEALASALEVDIGGGIIIPVVSIPALAALKLIAWDDRGLENNKDAQDLLFLLQHYHDAGNQDRLYDDAYALLEACDYDLPRAGAALLGNDTAFCLHEPSLRALLTVLDDTRKRDRLLVHMTRSVEAEPETAAILLDEFARGLRSRIQA